MAIGSNITLHPKLNPNLNYHTTITTTTTTTTKERETQKKYIWVILK